MGSEDYDDSSGKNKRQDAKTRSGLLVVALLIGACAGVIFAERVYIHFQDEGAASAAGDGGTAIATAATSGRKAARRLGQVSMAAPRSELEKLLRKVAPDGEVMIGISNYNLVPAGELVSFLDALSHVTIPNFLIVAIDAKLRDFLQEKGINCYYKDIQIEQSQKDTGSNHAISALKFKIIREFLDLGYNVLLSDIDVVWLDNPFKHLYRDADIEGMTDGFDRPTAYGHIDGLDDPSMGWARYAQATRHMNLNSGLFYIKANERTVNLMDRIAARLAKEKAWDQSVYNEEIFFLSHDDYVSPNVSVRVMNYYKFMNSKVLFKEVRHIAKASQPKPVSVHINYHPDKHERQNAVMKYYIDGDTHALDRFPGGSEPGT